MTPLRHLPVESVASSIEHAVIAIGTAFGRYDEIGGLRRTLQAPGRDRFPASFLKHSDEQTVLCLAAVIDAVCRHGMVGHEFTEWGVLAAPRYLGREMTAVSIVKFAQEKAWGVSPHFIPHRSLHSLSGTVSQALGLRGPNFGVAGGPHGASELVLAATAILAGGTVPGIWAIMSGWDPEVIPKRPNCDDAGDVSIPVCRAVAIALQPCPQRWSGARLRVACDGSAALSRTSSPNTPTFSVESLFAFLNSREHTSFAWKLSGGGCVELLGTANGVENPN